MSGNRTARQLALALVLGWQMLACNSEVTDLREWKPSDHDHTSQPGQGQVDVSDSSANPLAAHGVSEVVLIAWRQNCVRCHGLLGRGDGPQAAMYSPPNLTDPERQNMLSDADILAVIQQGRGKMPASPLPKATLDGLVTLVRLLDASGRRVQAPAGSAPVPTASPTAPVGPEPAAPP